MKGLIEKLKSFFMKWARAGFQPVTVGKWEWFFVRFFFAFVVIWMFLDDPRPFNLDEQKHPNGIANLVDLTWLNTEMPWKLEADFSKLNEWFVANDIDFRLRIDHPGLWQAFLAAALILCGLYVAGVGLWIVLPLLVLVFTLPHSLQNSQGYILHKFQIVTLTILAQAVVVNYFKWVRPVSAEKLRSWMLYYSQGMIAATYVTSVVSKLVNSKGLWLWKTGYMAVDQQKARAQEYFRTLNPDYAGIDPIAMWMVDHPWLTRGLFSTGFFLEIAALAALHSRKWALLIGVSIIAMHRSIAAVMGLDFLNHELVLLIFFVNVPFWVIWLFSQKKKANEPLATR